MIILQVAHGSHVDLVTLTHEYHRALLPDAEWCFVLNNLHPLYRRNMHGGWNKLLWLTELATLEPDGTEILCVDADILIRKPFAFADACTSEMDFAGVFNAYCMFNTGVTFWRNSEKVRQALRNAWASGRGGGGFGGEQPWLNQSLTALKKQTLSQDWNKYQHAVGPGGADPIIQAWHGEGVERAKREIIRHLHRAA